MLLVFSEGLTRALTNTQLWRRQTANSGDLGAEQQESRFLKAMIHEAWIYSPLVSYPLGGGGSPLVTIRFLPMKRTVCIL